MSYCRFAHDSDVYVYAHIDGGYRIHVASNRHVSQEPYPELPAEWWNRPPEEVVSVLDLQSKWTDGAELVSIGLPLDGQDYTEETAGECADRLEKIRAFGYAVPDSAIAALRDESDDRVA